MVASIFISSVIKLSSDVSNLLLLCVNIISTFPSRIFAKDFVFVGYSNSDDFKPSEKKHFAFLSRCKSRLEKFCFNPSVEKEKEIHGLWDLFAKAESVGEFFELLFANFWVIFVFWR